jgi:folate-dependent phosphoribosylglycinamide formyltransferase PurN
LTEKVLGEDVWNQSVIKKRSEIIAKEAVKVWSADAAALLGKVIPKVEKQTAKRTVKKTAKRTVKKTAKRTVKKRAKVKS